MPTLYWTAAAQPVAQVTTLTVAGTIASETFTLTIVGVDLSVTATGSESAADIAAALAEAWNAAAHPYFTAAFADADADVVTLTAIQPGNPFTLSANATGTATLTAATTTASTGPADWDNPDNWSTGSAPVDGDTVVFTRNDKPVQWGLDQGDLALAELRIDHTYTGHIGLPDDAFTTASDTTDDTAREYRDTTLTLGATIVRIGESSGAAAASSTTTSATAAGGSPRIRLDTGSTQTQLIVTQTAARAADADLPPLRWRGSHASNTLHLAQGHVGIAIDNPTQTATLATIDIAPAPGTASRTTPASASPNHTAPTLTVGQGVTLTTLRQAAGHVTLHAAATTINQTAGSLITHGSGAIANATIAGHATFLATGTLTTLTITATGHADFAPNPAPRTITNCTLNRGSTLNLAASNPAALTFTNDIDLHQCTLDQITLITPPHVTVAVAPIE